MEELKINKIQEKEKVDVVCQENKNENCSKKHEYWHYLDCLHDCPNTDHNQAYKDTRW